jgi:hypothetical protein
MVGSEEVNHFQSNVEVDSAMHFIPLDPTLKQHRQTSSATVFTVYVGNSAISHLLYVLFEVHS